MFEGQPQAELDRLIKGNPEFKQLYQRHKELDKKVLDAELGVLPVDDTTLLQMKREKLAAKDRLSRLFEINQTDDGPRLRENLYQAFFLQLEEHVAHGR